MNDPTPTLPAPARRSHAGSLLLLLLLAIVLGAGGWYGWQQLQAQQARANADAQQQRDALDSRVEALRQAQRAQAQRLQQAEATNRVLRDEVLGIGQRAALIEDSVSRLADPDRHGAQALRLDQVELLLAIGQQRLQLDGDMDGAQRALALAAPLLDGLDDPAYLNLRQALAQERAALDALGADPRIRAQVLLDSLQTGIDATTDARTRDAASANLPWHQRLLRKFVQVQPSARAGLRDHSDREAAIAALQIETGLARAAIERRDEAGLRRALIHIDGWLQTLLAGAPQLAQKRRIVNELKTAPLRHASPLAGTTLQQLRALRGQ
ncbi:MAG: uroporphyrinogen-III C-methyltransferase [Thermomonas sp.]|uniref:hypothetical protein n=1 Tax=Thermomonas sp. TaxID=1971895 RepID=UPI0039E5D825